jgi:hypothetical protein
MYECVDSPSCPLPVYQARSPYHAEIGRPTHPLSRPFAKPEQTKPQQTLKKTCQQAFCISIPPAHSPNETTTLPSRFPLKKAESVSTGQRLDTCRRRMVKSSQARKRHMRPGRRRNRGVSGDVRTLATARE